MSNLLISYPQVFNDAVYYLPTNAYENFRSVEDLITGERYNYAQIATASGSTTRVEFDLGTGNSATIDHIIIARADMLISDDVTTVLIEGGNGASPAYSTVHNDASFASATLIGRNASDYFETFSTSTAYRWWRYSLSVSGSSKRPQSTIHIGTLFDMDTDADFQQTIIQPGLDRNISIDGTEHVYRTADPRIQLDLEWRGITDAKAETFMNTIVPLRYVFLNEVTDQSVLFGAELLHCEIVSAEHTDQKDGFNTIKARFLELIG